MIFDKVSANSSIAASILTFALTVLGFSDIKLSSWWHFVVAFIALIACYVLCLVMVEIALAVVDKFRRPKLTVDFAKDYSDIERIVHEISKKQDLYDQATSNEYKEILYREIQLLCQKLKEKIAVYTRDCKNPVIRNGPKIPDQHLFELYAAYCEAVNQKHTPQA